MDKMRTVELNPWTLGRTTNPKERKMSMQFDSVVRTIDPIRNTGALVGKVSHNEERVFQIWIDEPSFLNVDESVLSLCFLLLHAFVLLRLAGLTPGRTCSTLNIFETHNPKGLFGLRLLGHGSNPSISSETRWKTKKNA